MVVSGGWRFLMSEEPLYRTLQPAHNTNNHLMNQRRVQISPTVALVLNCLTTKGPMWGYPVFVLGAISSFLEPFRGRLSPNIDNVSGKLTLRYPHEGPWVVQSAPLLAPLLLEG